MEVADIIPFTVGLFIIILGISVITITNPDYNVGWLHKSIVTQNGSIIHCNDIQAINKNRQELYSPENMYYYCDGKVYSYAEVLTTR